MRGLLFSVLTKAAKGARWERLGSELDLLSAVRLAWSLRDQHFEVGVFKEGRFYWSTRYQDVFNSTVLGQ